MSAALAQNYQDQDTLHSTMVHSRGQDGAAHADVAGKLADMYGLYRQRHLTYGGGQYQASADYTTIDSLARVPHFNCHVQRHALSSAQNDTHELQKLDFQLNLIQAAGSMTAELKTVIAELTEKGADFTLEQREKFVTALFNTYQLQQANEGRIELTRTQMQQLAEDTLDIMTDLARDGILPHDLKAHSVDIIQTTAVQFDLPQLEARIEQFEADTSAEALLDHSIEALKETLQAMLDSDELDDETRLEIEDILEKLEDHEAGAPLPRDVIKALEGLSEKMQDLGAKGALSAEMTDLVEKLDTQTERVVEANIELRAEISGLTVSQIKAIDSYLDKLEAIGEALPEDEVELKDMIAEAVAKLDADPTSIEAVTALNETLETLDKAELADILEHNTVGMAQTLAMVKDQGQFIQKTLVDRISARDAVPPKMVQSQTELYSSLKTLRAAVIESLMPANSNRPAVFAPSKLTVVKPSSTYNSPKADKSVDPITPSAPKQPEAKTEMPKSPGQAGTSTETAGSSKRDEKNDNRAPEDKAPDQKGQPDEPKGDKPETQKNESPTASPEPNKPTEPRVEDHPIIQTIDKAMASIATGSNRITTIILETANTLGGGILGPMAKPSEPVKAALDTSVKKFNDYVEKAVEVIADKGGKPVEFVRENIASLVEAVKDKFEALKPQQAEKPTQYEDFSTESKQKSKTVFAAGVDTSKMSIRSIQSILAIGCGDCKAAFCGACKGGGELVKALNPFSKNTLSSAFGGVAGMFSREDKNFNAAPKRSGPK